MSIEHTLPTLLSDQQVAAILSTSRATVWRRVKDGSLPQPIKVGYATRWLRSEIDEIIAVAVAQRDQQVGPNDR